MNAGFREVIELIERVEDAADEAAQGTLVLPFDTRQKSRFRSALVSGEEVGVILPRGTVLRGGDRLRAADGRTILVEAAAERLSKVSGGDALVRTRVAYHLGNRHVRLQIDAESLRYRADHVLDDMVRGLGVEVQTEEAPFEPEAGAYGGGHHHHD